MKPPRFSLYGFGTLGVIRSSERQADFVSNPLRPDGPGFTRELDAKGDSRVGVQVTGDLTPKLAAVVQVILEQQHDGDIEPTVEWANLKYSFTDDFSVRLGRTALSPSDSSSTRAWCATSAPRSTSPAWTPSCSSSKSPKIC
ncbi:MAG TPA: hypothetical protein VMV46_02185 [Thermoanaerobaculia bacterium]|nr:hypothetical protein [Thermoanaerobaculia bacterium]